MKMGVIVNITEKEAVVLKSGGEFITLPRKEGWKKGDVISIEKRRPLIRPAFKRPWTAAAIAACLCLCFIFAGSGYRANYAQAALVSIDVNPSIELTLNRKDRVISSHALNGDGEELLSQIQLKGMECSEALAELLNAGELTPYLSENKTVVFTVFSEDPATQDRLMAEIQETADNALAAHHPDGHAECHAVSAEAVKAAHSCGVTAGKYVYLQKLKEADPKADLSNYSHCSIGEIEEHISQCENHRGTAPAADETTGSCHHSNQENREKKKHR